MVYIGVLVRIFTASLGSDGISSYIMKHRMGVIQFGYSSSTIELTSYGSVDFLFSVSTRTWLVACENVSDATWWLHRLLCSCLSGFVWFHMLWNFAWVPELSPCTLSYTPPLFQNSIHFVCHNSRIYYDLQVYLPYFFRKFMVNANVNRIGYHELNTVTSSQLR